MNLRFGPFFIKIKEGAYVGIAPAVNGLLVVPHHAQIVVALGKQFHELVLFRIDVLVFVDEDRIKFRLILFANIAVCVERARPAFQ